MTLSVLTQDVLRQPLVRIHPKTFCDLLALAETEGLPKQLAADLARFSDQMFRELNDLHDGTDLVEFAGELGELDPAHVPATLRVQLKAREEEPNLKEGAAEALAALRGALEGVEPEPVLVVERPKKVNVQRPSVPSSHLSPEDRRKAREASGRSGGGSGGSRSSGEKRVPRATPAAQRDESREVWIREDVLSRLQSYGPSGLKEAILVAGAKHRSPFSDMGDDEVRAVLRKLGREGAIRFSAGRWSSKGMPW